MNRTNLKISPIEPNIHHYGTTISSRVGISSDAEDLTASSPLSIRRFSSPEFFRRYARIPSER
jgi:hypothetical protein